MTEVEVTWRRLLAVWWLLCWRSAIAAVAIGFATGLVFGLASSAVGLDEKLTRTIITLSTASLGLLVYLFVLRSAFRKTFRGFRIAMIKA
jgi:ABC-type uncharacterized transport system permease subunit